MFSYCDGQAGSACSQLGGTLQKLPKVQQQIDIGGLDLICGSEV
jgi:hypothetical protein